MLCFCCLPFRISCMRSFRITYSTAIILTLMPVTCFIALQSPGKIMLLCSSNNCIAVTAKNRRSTVIIICKRRMSVVYCHSHRCGISDFVGHNNGLLSVSRIKRTLSVCKCNRVSVDGNAVRICLFYRNNLCFAICLTVCNSGNNRGGIINHYAVRADISDIPRGI